MTRIEEQIYRLKENSNPYDEGMLIVSAKDTEQSLQLKVIEKNMRFSTYVDVLFGDKDKISINKQRNPHALTCGNGWFVVYPNRMGYPLCFVKEGEGNG